MRLLAFIFILSFAPVAMAQDSVVDLICQSKPSKQCVLDMAVSASLKVPPGENQTPPWGRIVETASRAGLLDTAIAIAPRIRKTDAIAAADLWAAATRADRLADIRPAMSALESSEAEHGFVIAPVLVELGRDAELHAFLKTITPPPGLEQTDLWYINGDLRAGRTKAALVRLDDIADEIARKDAAYFVATDLMNSDNAAAARPLVPYLEGTTGRLMAKARLSGALADLPMARSVLEKLSTVATEDREYFINDVIDALARSGDWQGAIELSHMLPEMQQTPRLAGIAGISGRPEAFSLLEKSMNAAPPGETRDSIRRIIASSLIRAGYVSVAGAYLDSAGEVADENTRTAASAALARTGHPSEAVAMARSVQDPYRRAWAIWEVAHNLSE